MKRDMELVRSFYFLPKRMARTTSSVKNMGKMWWRGMSRFCLMQNWLSARLCAMKLAVILRLTWAGHEFLDNARNDKIWRGVLSKIKSAALTVSFDVLAELLKSGAMSAIQHLQ